MKKLTKQFWCWIEEDADRKFNAFVLGCMIIVSLIIISDYVGVW